MLESITVTPIIPTMWEVPEPVEVPGAPGPVVATARTGGADLTWTAPAEDGGAEVTEFRVYQDGIDSPVATTSGLSATILGLVPGSTASFAVSAVNAAGEGPQSAWSTAVTIPDGATAPPARGTLSHDNGWDNGLADGDYNITMNLWWGQNGSSFRLFENGTLVRAVPLAYRGLSPQRATVPITGKPNGTCVYTGELVNSKGVTATSKVTVKVSQASPGKPVLVTTTVTATGPSP